MADHSGDGSDGGRDDDDDSEEETAEDRAFVDDRPVKRRKLPRVRASEKIVSDDELDKLKDTCAEIIRGPKRKRVLLDSSEGEDCGASSESKHKKKPKKQKRAYANASDEERATKSDLEFISSSEEDGEFQGLKQVEQRAQAALSAFVQRQGVKLSTDAKKPAKSVLTADAHKTARRNAFENTMAFLRANSASQALSLDSDDRPAKLTPRVRPTEAHRQLASVFTGRAKPQAEAASSAKPPAKAASSSSDARPGLVVNPVTKEVSYRHRDGRLSPRPDAL